MMKPDTPTFMTPTMNDMRFTHFSLLVEASDVILPEPPHLEQSLLDASLDVDLAATVPFA